MVSSNPEKERRGIPAHTPRWVAARDHRHAQLSRRKMTTPRHQTPQSQASTAPRSRPRRKPLRPGHRHGVVAARTRRTRYRNKKKRRKPLLHTHTRILQRRLPQPRRNSPPPRLSRPRKVTRRSRRRQRKAEHPRKPSLYRARDHSPR